MTIPVLLLNHVHAGTVVVGQVFAGFGAATLVSALAFGRVDSEGRERLVLVGTMLATAVALVILAFAGTVAIVFLAALLAGLFVGAQNVAIFSVRQRRTDPAWFGRAFAVSMSLNYMGTPLGSALAGALIARSYTLAFLVGAAFNIAGAIAAMVMIPASTTAVVRLR